MKHWMLGWALLAAIASAGWSEGRDRELAVLANTQRNLKTIATALEMWAADHNGDYPDSLQPLVTGYYLRRVPPQIDGSFSWNYRREGQRFMLSDHWDGFPQLGVPERIHYHSDQGIDRVVLSEDMAVFPKQAQLNGRWLSWRSREGLEASWERFGAKISARLAGRNPGETPTEQLEREKDIYASWSSIADPASLQVNGWTVVGAYQQSREGRRQVVLAQRGERVLEIELEDRESKDGQRLLSDVRSLLSQI